MTNLKYISIIIISLFGIILPTVYLRLFHIISYISLFLVEIIYFLKNLRLRKFDLESLSIIFISFILFFLIKEYPTFYLSLMPIIVGIYFLLISISKIMILIIYKDIPISKISVFLTFIIYLFFAMILFIFPIKTLKGLTIFISLFFMIIAILKIYNRTHNDKHQIVIKEPSILIAIKPYREFLKIKGQKFNNNQKESTVEVLIHIRDSFRGMFGHVDLIYNDYVYSYGNYDKGSYLLLDAIGDGVLFKTPKKEYIKYCKSYGKTLFCFGLKLTNKEEQELNQRFLNIMHNTYLWDKNNIVKNTYIDKLNKQLNVTFYKFKEGYYQNYCFLNYNCVKFIEEIISPQILNFTSISTPGTLYSYLENEYIKKDSKILYKKIY